jgi:hypothetical protein
MPRSTARIPPTVDVVFIEINRKLRVSGEVVREVATLQATHPGACIDSFGGKR